MSAKTCELLQFSDNNTIIETTGEELLKKYCTANHIALNFEVWEKYPNMSWIISIDFWGIVIDNLNLSIPKSIKYETMMKQLGLMSNMGQRIFMTRKA